LVDGIPNGLELLGENSHLLEILPGIGRFFDVFVCPGLAIFQQSKVDALSSGRGGKPRTDFSVVLDLVQVFQKFQTDALKNIGRIGGGKTELDRNRVDEPLVAQDQSLPGLRVSFETHRHQFGIRILLVTGLAHYRCFLDFQKLSRAKKSMTPDEIRTM
jgi:hypothetical protein